MRWLVLALLSIGCREQRSSSHSSPSVDANAIAETSTDVAAEAEAAAEDAPSLDQGVTRWRPPNAGKHRAVLLVHGAGGKSLFVSNPSYKVYPEAIAAAGYEVFMPDLADCRGRECVERCTRTIAAMARQEGVIDAKVGVIGFSRGGYVAMAIAAAGTTPPIAAVVSLYGGISEDAAAGKSFPPTLVLHGDADEAVPPSSALEIERVLKAHGAPVEVHMYPGQKHGFTGKALEDSIRRSVEMLARHLG